MKMFSIDPLALGTLLTDFLNESKPSTVSPNAFLFTFDVALTVTEVSVHITAQTNCHVDP